MFSSSQQLLRTEYLLVVASKTIRVPIQSFHRLRISDSRPFLMSIEKCIHCDFWLEWLCLDRDAQPLLYLPSVSKVFVRVFRTVFVTMI